MAITAPRQFCGNEHWSGEPCKVCDALKARARGSNRVPSRGSPPLQLIRDPADPCPECAKHEKLMADVLARMEKQEAELTNYRLKAERQRAAVLERVRKSREKKAAAK